MNRNSNLQHICVGIMLLAWITCVTSRSCASQKPQDRANPVAASSKLRLRFRIAVDQAKWEEQIRRETYRIPADFTEGLQAMLVDKLQGSGWFQVMEREITGQRQMRVEDLISDRKQESVPHAGLEQRQKRTPAQFVVTPTIVGFNITGAGNSGIKVGPIQLGGKKTTVTLLVNIRVFDAQTSAELESSTTEGTHTAKESGISGTIGGIQFDTKQFKESALGKALDMALEKAVAFIVQRLTKEHWLALVAAQDKNTGRLIINAGAASGVETGLEFDVFKAGDAVIDPDTGDVLSHGDETKIGRVKVVRVDRNVAYADVVSGSGFTPRNVVRPAD